VLDNDAERDEGLRRREAVMREYVSIRRLEKSHGDRRFKIEEREERLGKVLGFPISHKLE
jgi:hypothetical protein